MTTFTKEQRLELQDAVHSLLTDTRAILRPSEMIRYLTTKPEFYWPNCLHVGFQCKELARDKKIRKVWCPTGESTAYTRFAQPGFKGWCVADLTRAEIGAFRNKTLQLGRALEVKECVF